MLFVFSFTSVFAQSADEQYKEALAYINTGKGKQALEILQSLIAKDKKQSRYYIASSNALFLQKKYPEAFAVLDLGVQLCPDSINMYTHRADVFYEIKEFKKAAKDYFSAIDLTEDSTELSGLYMMLGTMYLIPSNAEDALKYLNKALALDSTNMAVYNQLAMAYDLVGEEDKVIETLELLLDNDSLRSFALANLGFFTQQYGRYKESLEYLDIAIEEYGHAYTYNNRAYSKLMLGDHKGAMEDVETSLEMDPSNAWAYKVRAQINIAMGKKGKKVCKDLEMALKLQFTKQYGPEVENLYRKHCQ